MSLSHEIEERLLAQVQSGEMLPAHLARSPEHEHLTIEEHRGIVVAIEAGAADLAAARMSDHLNRAKALYSTTNINR